MTHLKNNFVTCTRYVSLYLLHSLGFVKGSINVGTTDLLFDWFKFNQTCESVSLTKQVSTLVEIPTCSCFQLATIIVNLPAKATLNLSEWPLKTIFFNNSEDSVFI